MDVVSDILGNITVKNHVTGLLRLNGDWAFESPAADVSVFHLIFDGTAHVTFNGRTERLEKGDMVLFTRGHGHKLGSAPDAPSVTFAEEDTRVRMHSVDDGQISSVDKRGDGPETSIICARFNFSSRLSQELVREFSDQVLLRGMGQETFSAFEPMLLRTAQAAHSNEPGALAELDSLVNFLYLSFMRNWLTKFAEDQPGWIRGLNDPNISRALKAIHADPTRKWSVQELAAEVGMSRARFAARFADVVRDTPARYQLRWRMSLAARQLETHPQRPLNQIAFTVGYETENAFFSSFKRVFGKTPNAWRRDFQLSHAIE